MQELRRQLQQVSRTELSEVDLCADDEPESTRRFFGIITLVSGSRAFLTYLRYEGDAGLNSCEPTYTGPVEAELGGAGTLLPQLVQTGVR